MTHQAEAVLAEALRRSEEERGEIADILFDTLETESEEDVEKAWDDEIARRLEDVRSGKEKPIPWEEARKQIFGEVDGNPG